MHKMKLWPVQKKLKKDKRARKCTESKLQKNNVSYRWSEMKKITGFK